MTATTAAAAVGCCDGSSSVSCRRHHRRRRQVLLLGAFLCLGQEMPRTTQNIQFNLRRIPGRGQDGSGIFSCVIGVPHGECRSGPRGVRAARRNGIRVVLGVVICLWPRSGGLRGYIVIFLRVVHFGTENILYGFVRIVEDHIRSFWSGRHGLFHRLSRGILIAMSTTGSSLSTSTSSTRTRSGGMEIPNAIVQSHQLGPDLFPNRIIDESSVRQAVRPQCPQIDHWFIQQGYYCLGLCL